jgi:hypothetical protein
LSKLESPMTRWYWHTVSGLLLEEFCPVNRTATCGGRWVDALVLPERDMRIAGRSETVDIAPGERAILVQTKASRSRKPHQLRGVAERVPSTARLTALDGDFSEAILDLAVRRPSDRQTLLRNLHPSKVAGSANFVHFVANPAF